jgi:hypothetical protein
MTQVDYLFSDLVHLSIFVFELLFRLGIQLACSLSSLHTTLHVLDKLSQLPILFVLLGEGLCNVSILVLHLTDDYITLLELLLDDLKLLGVSKRVLTLDHLFELVAKTGTFIHVQFDFDFQLL